LLVRINLAIKITGKVILTSSLFPVKAPTLLEILVYRRNSEMYSTAAEKDMVSIT